MPPTVAPTDSNPEPTNTSSNDESRFVSHARIVAGLTLISRMAGVVRDAVCSRFFGAGPIWSAFAFAFLIPNLFRRLFGEGALSAAFLPEYARLAENDPKAAGRFATLILGFVLAVLGIITIVGEVVLLIVLNWNTNQSVANGVAGDAIIASRELVITLLMVMLPYMPLICLVALIGAMLQSHRTFGPTAAAPIVLNLCIISAAAWAAFAVQSEGGDATQQLRSGVILVSISVIVAGILQLGWSVIALTRIGVFRHIVGQPSAIDSDTRKRGKQMIRLLIPMLIGLGALQLNTLIDGLIASYPIWASDSIFGTPYPLDVKSNSILFFTQRLYQFPLGVFGIAVATAIFPALARTAKLDDDRGAFSQTFRQGIRLSLFIGLPASLGLILVRTPLASVILRGNQFVDSDVARVAWVLCGYAPAVWAYSLNQVLTRAFYAHDDAKTPVRVALWMMGLNLILNCSLIWWLGEAGLAWSTSICAILQALILLRLSRRFLDEPILGRDVEKAVRWTIVATLAMGAVVGIACGWLSGQVDSTTWMGHFIVLATGMGLGIGTFVAITRVFRMEELGWIIRGRTS